ncbi:MAG TPA: hypothetical protein VMT00_02645 [Thermoanaerobaculia bacterium]|nr:hypothetical protein [Thermoanaerobaculia bacterium]
MKKGFEITSLSPGQAQYVLSRMAQDRVINNTTISRYLDEMQREIHDLENRLEQLRSAQGNREQRSAREQAAPARRQRTRSKRATRSRARGSSAPRSKEVLESQKLQGIYLSLMKQIAPEKRPPFSKIAKDQSREEAIRRMRTALKK